MFSFIKKLYELRFKNINVILLDNSQPGKDNSYFFKPVTIFLSAALICFCVTVIVCIVLLVTPIGSALYNKEDEVIRAQVENITERVLSLQDSLIVRETQLVEMKNIIRLSLDTTLVLDQRFSSMINNEAVRDKNLTSGFNSGNSENNLSTSGVFLSNILKSAPEFPSKYPVNGTLTRGYEPNEFHFGIDIATNESEIITSIADGTIVNASWTISDGYVISIQHNGGILSIYKHCSAITKKNGDAVLKGDILGTTGNVGVSSSGSHLHVEIWKDGLPKDPQFYLVQ